MNKINSTFNHEGSYTCVCGKTFTNSQSFNGHKSHCEQHLKSVGKYDALVSKMTKFIAGGQKASQDKHREIVEKKQQQVEQWISEQHTCEKCGKIMTERFATGRFCSRECANSRSHSEESKQKISNTLRLKYKHNKHAVTKKAVTKKKETVCRICGDINCTNQFCKSGKKEYQIEVLSKYFTFDRSKIRTHEVFQEFDRVGNMLCDMYHVQHMSSTEIVSYFNYPNVSTLLTSVFKWFGIKSKNCSEATLENLFCGRISLPQNQPNYIHGYHTTWENKVVFLRSSYEFDFACILDEQKISYDVECLRINYMYQNQNHIAVPDFYLPDTNEIVEVKSTHTLDLDRTKAKFNEYSKLGYNTKLWLEHNFVDINNL